MIGKLFDEDSPFGVLPRDDEGCPFLDRDPDTFALVLDYLRRSCRLVGASSLTSDMLDKILDDAEYYGLGGLVDLITERKKGAEDCIKAKIKARADHLSINVGGKLFSTQKSTLVGQNRTKIAKEMEEAPRDEDGRIFLASPPPPPQLCFEHVLRLPCSFFCVIFSPPPLLPHDIRTETGTPSH
jgi:hypothetical protein